MTPSNTSDFLPEHAPCIHDTLVTIPLHTIPISTIGLKLNFRFCPSHNHSLLPTKSKGLPTPANKPNAMDAVQVHASPVKDGRRVLGEKSVNASLTPSRKRFFDLQKPCSTEASPKPLHEVHDSRTVTSSFSSQSHAGQKRTIDEVEGSTRESEPRKALMTAVSEVKDVVATYENTTRTDTPVSRVRDFLKSCLH